MADADSFGGFFEGEHDAGQVHGCFFRDVDGFVVSPADTPRAAVADSAPARPNGAPRSDRMRAEAPSKVVKDSGGYSPVEMRMVRRSEGSRRRVRCRGSSGSDTARR